MSIYQFEVEKVDGTQQSLSDYEGKVVLIVNTASKCGLVGQLEGLESLYKKYKDEDFVVLGFPSNQFLRQEPKSNEEIVEFCQLNYGVSFPIYAKLDVKGKAQSPLYQYLVESTGGKKVEWNFAKFLINKEGEVEARYSSKTAPKKLEEDIKQLVSN